MIKTLIRRLTRSECPKSVLGHFYGPIRHDLNGGLWHHGAIGRAGRMCANCNHITWEQSDQEFYDSLPEWLKRDPALQGGLLAKVNRT